MIKKCLVFTQQRRFPGFHKRTPSVQLSQNNRRSFLRHLLDRALVRNHLQVLLDRVGTGCECDEMYVSMLLLFMFAAVPI